MELNITKFIGSTIDKHRFKKLKRGDKLELNIVKYAFEGKGIAKVDRNLVVPSGGDKLPGNGETNYIVFAPGTYPGDRVIAELIKIKKSYAEAKMVDLVSPSIHRVYAYCKYFGTCGGCRQQDLNYEMQLLFKEQFVKESFGHISGLKDFQFEKIIPSQNVFYYRNKMEFSFGDRRWLSKDELDNDNIPDKNFALGLHIPRIFDKVLDIDECFLQSEISNDILNYSRNFFKERKASIYSTKTHVGYLRNLVIRQSGKTKEVMVNLVTSEDNDELMEDYTSELIKVIPKITTVVNNINLKKASVAVGDYEKVFYGDGVIYDKIGDYKFRISANSFFQTNTLQAENLYKTAMEFAELKGDEIVYDLYSGAGTIGIYISGKAKMIYGFESVESAVNDADENAKINNVKNVKFIKSDLYKSFLPQVKHKNIPEPDTVIIDPPRSGMHKNTIEDVINLNPKKIVYVSCNPATQARDIKFLIDSNYKLIKMRPVDMFPHTYHVENVALLTK